MMAGNIVDKSCQPNQNAWIHVLQYLIGTLCHIAYEEIVSFYEYVLYNTKMNIN